MYIAISNNFPLIYLTTISILTCLKIFIFVYTLFFINVTKLQNLLMNNKRGLNNHGFFQTHFYMLTLTKIPHDKTACEHMWILHPMILEHVITCVSHKPIREIFTCDFT